MPGIPVKRFEYLDKETNIAIAKFGSDMDAGVYNSPLNDLKSESDKLKSLINSALQNGAKDISLPNTSGVQGLYSDATRKIKGLGSSITDLGSFGSGKLSGYLNDITGNSAMGKSLTNMAQSCSGRGLGYALPGKPYSPSINCGAGKVSLGYSGSSQSCNASSYGDLLNKLTGGMFGAGFQDLNSALKKIMSLAGYGYNMGMCGVFGALGSGLPKDMLSKASGGLMATFGEAGNTNAMLDLAKSSVGLLPLSTYPAAIDTWMSNYQLPSNVGSNGLTDMADRTVGGLELIDENWATSDYDDAISMCKAPGYSQDLSDVFSAKLTDKSFGADELDVVNMSDYDFAFASYGSDSWSDLPDDTSFI